MNPEPFDNELGAYCKELGPRISWSGFQHFLKSKILGGGFLVAVVMGLEADSEANAQGKSIPKFPLMLLQPTNHNPM